MKKFLCFAVAAMFAGAAFATTAGTDSAANAAYADDWTTGDNGGSGFGAWTILTGGSGGPAFISSSGQGGVNVGSSGFALSANFDLANSWVSTSRPFDGPMNVGDIFSVTLGINANGGSDGIKRFSVTCGTPFVIQNIGLSSAITYTTDSSSGTIFQNYGTTAMDFIFEYLTGNNLRVMANGRDGTETFDQTFTVLGAPVSFTAYASMLPAGDDARLYFNNLEMRNAPVPEPATMSLLGLGALAMAIRRRRS